MRVTLLAGDKEETDMADDIPALPSLDTTPSSLWNKKTNSYKQIKTSTLLKMIKDTIVQLYKSRNMQGKKILLVHGTTE